ncbi:MAG: carbon storage regulator [Bryobacterales bacterium]|nr:carbon storage regulator [Bryobacterales bacterium]
MLVIRRREGEAILVGEDVEIEVLEITPARVKLGIRAPERVPILRKELQATREQNLAAARGVTAEGLASLRRALGGAGNPPHAVR